MADNYISTNMNTGVDVKQALERIESYQPDLFVWTEISDSVTVDLKSPTTYSGIKDPGDYVIYKFSNGPSNIPSTLSPILLSLRNGNICVTANGSSYIYDGSAWHDINEVVDDTTVIYIKDNAAPLRTKNTFWFDTSKFDGTENGYIDLKYYNETTKTWESVFNSKNYLKKSALDPDNKKLDIFDYIDEKVANAVGDYGDFLKHIDNKLTLIHVSADDRVKYAKIINASELQELINTTYKPALKSAVDTSVNSELNTTKLEEDLTTLETTFDDHINGKINITWAQGTLSSSQNWQSVCYGNGKFVAVNSSSDIFAYSTDGINWTQSTMPSKQEWNSVCYGNGKFVAVVYNSNKFAYSTNGINWTEGTLPSSQKWFSVCYGNGKFEAICASSNIFAYSTDGINWTQSTMPSTAKWIPVCYGNDKFVTIVNNSNVFAYSSDGITWTQGTLPSKQYWQSVCYGNGKFVAVTNDNISRSDVFAYSSDGITWTQGTLPSRLKLVSICYGNNKFVAIASFSDVFFYSSDGINWIQGTMPHEIFWFSVCYGNGKFVAIVYDSNIFAYLLNDIPPHVTADDIARWKNKADANHTHDYTTGTTKIDASQIVDGTFTADKLPDEIKERYYAASKKTIDLSTTKVGDTFRLGKYQVESEDPWDIDWEIVDVRDGYQVAMTKQIIDFRAFDAKEPTNTNSDRKKYGNSNWSVSNISQFLNSDQESWYSAQHQYDALPISDNLYEYMNGTNYNAYNNHKGFLYYWSDKDKSLLKDMTLTLANNTETDGGGSYTWTGKVWLPTYTQMGFGNNNSISEGTQFSKFIDNDSRIKYIHEKCAENNELCKNNSFTKDHAETYWLSSLYTDSSCQVYYINYYGKAPIYQAYSGANGLVPCICLPRSSTTIEVENIPEEEFSNSALTDTDRATKYHNGNAFYFSTTDAYGKLTYRWFRIIDSTKIGTADWANGVSEFTATESVLDWNSISGRPTTLEEFGITNDLYTKTQVDEKFSSSKTKATELSEKVKELDGTVEYEFEGVGDIGIGSTNTYETGLTNLCKILNYDAKNKSVAVSMIYGNNTFITTAANLAGGMSDVFAYSTDGINWTQGILPSSQYWKFDCYANGKFFAFTVNLLVGGDNSNVFAYSNDGINWTQGTMPKSGIFNICYGNDIFVAGTGCIENIYYYSTDGINWTQGTMPSKTGWNCPCYGNGKFVVTGYFGSNSGVFAYSTDGITWTQGTMPNKQTYHEVYYGNGKFVAIAYDPDTFAYSTDGINWTQGNSEKISGFRSLFIKNDKIYAIAKITSKNDTSYSGHALVVFNPTTCDWDYIYDESSLFNVYNSVCYGDGKFVAIGSLIDIFNYKDVSSSFFAYSTDGINWTQGTMPSKQDWWSVCYGNDKFVAVVNGSNTFAYSTDGITWTEGTLPSSQNWWSVCYGNDKYVAITYNSNVFAYSSDGINWTQGTMPSNQNWYSVCYGNDKFVAMTNGSDVFAYSTDGIIWTQGTMPSKQSWYSVCYGNGKFVAVSSSTDKFAYSTDGITWTEDKINL